MNRTWVAIILGVFLGFTLMGAILRGCESGAGAAAIPASALPSRPMSRIPARPAATPEPTQSLLATLGPPSAPVTRLDRAPFAAQGARGVTQKLDGGGASRPVSGLEFSRQLTLSRAGASFGDRATTASGQASPPVPAVTDAGLRGEFARRNELLRQTADAGTGLLDARLLAQSRLRSQLDREQNGRPSGDGSSASAAADDASGEIVGNGADSGQSFDNVGDLLRQARSSAFTINSIGGGAGGAGLVSGGSTGATTGGAIDQTPIGPDVAGDTPGPPDTGLPSGDLPPSGSGDNGADMPTDAPTAPPVIAVWQPVSTDSSCVGLTGTRTNDLFLGFTDPTGVQIITSAPPISLNIVGGVFVQNSAGGNLPPDDATLMVNPCVAFDSFLTIGDADGVFFAQPPDRAAWGTELNAAWVTPLSSVFGVVGTQDPARFGDDRFYIRVGRFTATGNPDFVGGSLIVNTFNTATFSTDTLMVPVEHNADLWFVEDTGPISVSLVGFSFNTISVLGGETATATITISDPAPVGGVEILLASSSTLVSVPASLTIPEGATSASFDVVTPPVPGTFDLTISARLGATVIFAGLRLDAIPTDVVLRAVSVSPKIIRGGKTALGRVTLARVAPAGGRIVSLSVSDPMVVTVPPSVTVPAGATEATFPVRALVLPERRAVLIWAAVGEQVRTTSVLVTLPADVSGDGRVDSADLAQLLNAFNTGDPQSDLNGDGTVNGADIAIILNDFDPSAPPPDLDPFSGEVIARWIPAAISAECPDLAMDRTNDLYLGFRLRPSPPVLTSADPAQVTIASGSFVQNPFGNNFPPSPAFISLVPCLAFDSYLTIGGARPAFVTSPDPTDWGAALDALWFTQDLTNIFIEQDVAKFGDSRFYLRIGRFTANEGAQVAGSIRVDFAPVGGSVQTQIVQITNCAVCWRSFDLTGDGFVSVADLERVMDLVGTQDMRADLNGDGVVTASDVALFVQSAALPSGG